MQRKATVKQVRFPAGRRVLVISDIHGNLPFLEGVLRTANYGPEDILILLGDLIEKGPDSLAVLRYVMELSRTRTVYTVRGNCDNLVEEFTQEARAIGPEFYRHYLSVWNERSILIQMGRAAGFELRSYEDLPVLRQIILDRFAPELAFLSAMPVILETPDYLFVHGGVPGECGLTELNAWKCMKNDDFLSQGYSFRRWCIVGHWPVTLYDPHIPSAAPLLERERHIASIDGGCVLKLDGQLNALVLPETPGGEFSWYSYDGLPTAVALDPQAPSEDPVNIRWGRNWVEVLERGEELSRCRHRETGRELDILTSYLYGEGEETRCEDSTDYRLEVAPGDRLSVVRRLSDRALVKRAGVTGWYFGRLGESWPAGPVPQV